MTTAAAVLTAFRERGVEFQAEAGRLKFRGATDTLTDADRELLRQHKADLLALLEAGPTPGLPAFDDLPDADRQAAVAALAALRRRGVSVDLEGGGLQVGDGLAKRPKPERVVLQGLVRKNWAALIVLLGIDAEEVDRLLIAHAYRTSPTAVLSLADLGALVPGRSVAMLMYEMARDGELESRTRPAQPVDEPEGSVPDDEWSDERCEAEAEARTARYERLQRRSKTEAGPTATSTSSLEPDAPGPDADDATWQAYELTQIYAAAPVESLVEEAAYWRLGLELAPNAADPPVWRLFATPDLITDPMCPRPLLASLRSRGREVREYLERRADDEITVVTLFRQDYLEMPAQDLLASVTLHGMTVSPSSGRPRSVAIAIRTDPPGGLVAAVEQRAAELLCLLDDADADDSIDWLSKDYQRREDEAGYNQLANEREVVWLVDAAELPYVVEVNGFVSAVDELPVYQPNESLRLVGYCRLYDDAPSLPGPRGLLASTGRYWDVRGWYAPTSAEAAERCRPLAVDPKTIVAGESTRLICDHLERAAEAPDERTGSAWRCAEPVVATKPAEADPTLSHDEAGSTLATPAGPEQGPAEESPPGDHGTQTAAGATAYVVEPATGDGPPGPPPETILGHGRPVQPYLLGAAP